MRQLESLEADPFDSILDPVKLLGNRFVFVDDDQANLVRNGCVLALDDVILYRYDQRIGQDFATCGCTNGIHESKAPAVEGEIISVVTGNTLQALYEYDAKRNVLKSRCGFAVGVKRGSDI